MGCLGVLVTRSEISSKCRLLTCSLMGPVQNWIIHSPTGLPSIVLIQGGLLRWWRRSWSFKAAAWLIKFPDPESLMIATTEAWFECMIIKLTFPDNSGVNLWLNLCLGYVTTFVNELIDLAASHESEPLEYSLLFLVMFSFLVPWRLADWVTCTSYSNMSLYKECLLLIDITYSHCR